MSLPSIAAAFIPKLQAPAAISVSGVFSLVFAADLLLHISRLWNDRQLPVRMATYKSTRIAE
jgi:hypothetical protein